MTILDKAEKINHKLVEIRNDLHQHPELSFQEVRTSAKIADILKELGIDEIHTGIAKTGVVGLLRGGLPGKTIALRADMDALPIQEANEVSYKSQNEGVMHACGHDVHVTSVLGAAMLLNDMKNEIKGNVKFIFQPSEEIFGGAKMMVDEGVLDSPPKVDAIIGIHVWHDVDLGMIGVRTGPAMASADRFEIVIKSPGGHGAAPHLTSDPIVAAAQIINSFQTVVSRAIDPLQPAVLSVCKINGGHAFNIIPDEVRMEGTVRTLDQSVRTRAMSKINDILDGISKVMDIECHLDYTEGCPPLVNNPEIIGIIEKSVSDVLGNGKTMKINPTMGGEDFTYFASAVPGAMLCLGIKDEASGITSPVHRSTFDVSPKALTIGAAVLAKSALTYLKS